MTGDEFKQWREAAGLTQADLQRELGVKSRQTIREWEKKGADSIPRMVSLAIFALETLRQSTHKMSVDIQSDGIMGFERPMSQDDKDRISDYEVPVLPQGGVKEST